jgi:hypothetical protein
MSHDTIKLPNPAQVPAPQNPRVMIELLPDGNMNIQSNVPNMYTCIGIMTAAVNGMLSASKEPPSRIIRP